MNSNEIRNNRATLIAQARSLVSKAEAEKRDLSGEENEQWNKMMSDVDTMAAQIEKAERAEKLENLEAELRHTSGRKTSPSAPTSVSFTPADRKQAIRNWALAGTDKANVSSDAQYRAAELGINLNSRSLSVRALAAGSSSTGGATVPSGLSSEIEEKLKYYCPLRNYARVLTTDTGASLDWPRVSDIANSCTIVSEGGSIATNVDPSFDKVTIGAYKFSTTYVLVSTELLQDSQVDIEALLADLLAERMARGQESYFFNGTGSSQPQGIVTAASAVANLAATNVMTAGKLIDLVHGCDIAYRQNGVFFANDATIASIRKLVDTTGQFIWQPGLQAGQPDRLLGYPIVPSNQMATSGDNVPLVLFGDARHFLIRDVGSSLVINKVIELFAANGQVGFNLQLRSSSNLIGHTGSIVSLNAQDV